MSRINAIFDIDEERSVSIATRLYDEFYNHKGFFKDYRMPEYILPENLAENSKEYANYLTFIISIDYMTDAVKLWSNAREAYRVHPEIFYPNIILNLDEMTLTSFVENLGARYPKSGTYAWKSISKVLVEKYDGDPRNMTLKPLTIKEIKTKLKDFPYLKGNKLSNFYLRSMGEKGLLKISDFHDLDIPVDIQVARFTAYTGVLKPKSDIYEGCVHKEPLRGIIQGVWRNAAKQINTCPWKLDEPIWSVGSKLCFKGLCNKCPVNDLCDRSKGMRFKNDVLIWERT